MIVKKIWYKDKPIYKGSRLNNRTYYKGYFLFGFIPLYIEVDALNR